MKKENEYLKWQKPIRHVKRCMCGCSWNAEEANVYRCPDCNDLGDPTIGLYDREGTLMFENDYIIGYRSHCDGYIRKSCPKQLASIYQIKYLDYEAQWDFYEIKPIKECEEARKSYSYRVCADFDHHYGSWLKDEKGKIANPWIHKDLTALKLPKKIWPIVVTGALIYWEHT